MSTRSASHRDEPHHSEEIPTAVEQSPFTDDSLTMVEGHTDSGPTPTEGTPGDGRFDKFRRPTPSEIVQAVDAVNTESVDLAELARARAAASDEDEDEAADKSEEVDLDLD
ncbi:MAG: hypothetical protein KC933_00050 [Myxococcales bacterium]|nr:hypothetical protein [Myxococcales bacterium]MCB9647960.1 hypothetical protein [Deltaproteobacteria bacterium]